MSQFLICKSKKGLSKYGLLLNDITQNKELYIKVIEQYMHNENFNNIWVIDKIDDIVNSLENNLEFMKEIIQNSEKMIFWYGTDFKELEKLYSKQSLINCLEKNIDNPCVEIYVYADLNN